MSKLRVAVLGSGQIGTDLAVKLSKRIDFQVIQVSGRRPDSPGLGFLSRKGIPTTFGGIDSILDSHKDIDLAFDCTSAQDHLNHWPLLQNVGLSVIDLTPSKIGNFFIPNVTKIEKPLNEKAININLVTCGGQAAGPLVHAVRTIASIARIEVASNIASLSAGPATRANIDEYISTTENVLLKISSGIEAKAILVLNPAEPPITMQNTLYFSFINRENVDEANLQKAITSAVRDVQRYAPGYRIRLKPTFVKDEFVISVLVRGSGDYLPEYSGNLDIINSAAIEAASEFARVVKLQKSIG